MIEHADVHRLQWDGREIVLVGTAHVSRQSAELVRSVIETEKPDGVCVELDERRYAALSKPTRWEDLDLRKVIKEKQLATLLINLLLASYQKKLGQTLGVLPGTELLEAAHAARELDIPVSLCDRDVRITLRRAWESTSFFRKSYLLASILTSLFNTSELSEEDLAKLRHSDVLSELMKELGSAMPEVKRVVIDERDIYLAEKIKATEGKRLVAVVGAGHVEGIKKVLSEDHQNELPAFEKIPEPSPLWSIVGWSIPVTVLASMMWIGWTRGLSAAGESMIGWILTTGTPAALGAVVALSHPLTILTAFVSAPITTLSPVLGVGYFTAFAQVMAQPPLVREFEHVLEAMGTFKGWWTNRLLRVFMAFILPTIGTLIGMWMASYGIFSSL